MLHVAQISFFLDPHRDSTRILQDWWPLVDAADMVAQAGLSVSVIQACCESQIVTRNSVTYHFLAPERGCSSIARGTAFAGLLRDLKADVFHVHGLGFSADILALAELAPDTPIFLQDHAEKVPRLWRRRAFRRGLSVAAEISFCALEQARPFVKAGLLDPQTARSEIPETSSRFTPGDQQAARLATGMHGDPAVLWVGHLNSNKDPLTVLAGVSAAVRSLPALQLWCCFGSAPLLSDVQALIEADPLLQGRVHLLGKAPHGSIEQLMRAADLFVLGSHTEGSGCSLIEALACGLPPVVTDIPSFRALTNNGKVGMLWPRGDAHAMCEALLSVASRPSQPTRSAVRAHFDKEVSFAAVGRKLVAAYRRLRNRDVEPPGQLRAAAGGSWDAPDRGHSGAAAPMIEQASAVTVPTVSIVLPTFNRLQYLRAAVDSVLAQTLESWELIVADDGSEGETAAYLLKLADLPRVKLLRLHHSGNPGAARNAAIREASGEYIAFLDSDDVWLPTKLEVQLGVHRARPACRWSYTALTRIGADGEVMHDEPSRLWTPHAGAIFEQLLKLQSVIATPSVLAERDLIEQAGGFDEGQLFFEDYDLWLRLSLQSEVTVIDEPLVLVRNHGKHFTADRVGVYEARRRLLEKTASVARTARLRSLVRREYVRNEVALAMACAAAGQQKRAFCLLWKSRKASLSEWRWWRTVSVAAAHRVAPSWLRGVIRRYRNHHSVDMAPR